MATLTKGKTFTNGELVTPQKLHELVDLGTVSGIVNADVSNSAAIALSKLATGALPTGITVASANIVDGTIVNADISNTAAIADTKLATISTAGKVSNSATTAASTNIANAIVTRDALGSFSANTITAALAGNASTASKLATARTITLGGDLSGSVSFDGSANATLTAAVVDDSHNHVISNVDGLQAALDGKQAAGSYAPATGIAPSAIAGTAVITTDSRLSNARTPTAHTHDDRYYTETEIDAKLAGLPVSGHTHSAADITSGTLAIARIPTGTTSTTVALGNHTHSGYAATSHTHDDRYYTESEVNTLLAGKLGTTATAAAATKLATARTINGVAFDGTANITIATGVSGTIPISQGGTGATTAATALTNLGAAAAAHTHSAADITSGTLANARTTATNANTASAIVARDASGNFSAGTITASLSGNATTATTLQSARTINGVSFNGSANITVTANPNSHTHGNITNAGAIGTTSGVPIITGTSGVLQAGSFGTTAGTYCQGNDSRLSDARTPTTHTHDDRYYTESEVNTLLAGKQASGSYVTNGGSVSSIQRVTAMPATPAANTLYIVIP